MGHPSLRTTSWISEAQESIPLRMVPQPMLILNGDTNLKHHVFLLCGLGDNASKESYFAYGGVLCRIAGYQLLRNTKAWRQ